MGPLPEPVHRGSQQASTADELAYPARVTTTMTEDVAAAAADALTCGACGAAVPRPAPGQFAPLWDQGWRWLGSLDLYSCPSCPPVVLDDEHGAHHAGAGVQS